MSSWVWIIPLITVVFLWSVNEHLNGRLKSLISGVLAVGILALCAVAVAISGWWAGLWAVVGAFVLGALIKGPALSVARLITPYPDLGADDDVPTLKSITGDLWNEEKQSRRQMEYERHRVATVDRAASDPRILDALNRHRCSRADLQALYERAEISMLPPDFRAQVLRNPELLEFFLEESQAGDFEGRYVRNFRAVESSFRLTLWAKHNPSGSEPNPPRMERKA